MTKMNSVLISFIIIVNLIYCSNSNTSLFTNKFETDTDAESVSKLCGVYEGRLNLIVYNKDKKLVSTSLRVNFDSDNFSFFNQKKKTLIQNFKMEDLQKINKIPLIRPVYLESNSNCFELIFQNSNMKIINLNFIPITLCSGNIDEKLNFLKQIVNKKQCQLNRIYRQKYGTDRTKVLENYDIINKLLEERKKKLLDMRNNDLNKNGTGTCCIKETDPQENQLTLDKDLEKLKKIKIEMNKENGKYSINPLKNNTNDDYILKSKKLSKEDYHRNLLLEKILDIKKELENKLGKNVYFRDDEKELAKRNRALNEFMKNLNSKSLKDLLNEYKNLIEKEKQKALKSNEDLLKYLKKIEQMPKGNFKMCLPKNIINTSYKNQIKHTCISIYGIDKIENIRECINDKNLFCKLCCDKYANVSETKLRKCKQGCQKSINKAELEAILDNSLDNLANKSNNNKNQSKENNDKQNENKKDKENKSLIYGLLNAYQKKNNEQKSQDNSKNNKDKNLQNLMLKELQTIDKLIDEKEKEKSFKKKFKMENEKYNNKTNSDSELEKLLDEERRTKKRLEKNKKRMEDRKKNQNSNLLLKDILDEYKNRKNSIIMINNKNLGEGKYNALFKGNLTNIKKLKPEESELLTKLKQDKQNQKLLDDILNNMRNDTISKFEKKEKKYDLLRRIFENKIKGDQKGKAAKKGESQETGNAKSLDINTLKNLQADENLKKLLPEYLKEKPSKAKIKGELSRTDLNNTKSSALNEAEKNKKIIDDLLNEVKNKSISEVNKEKNKGNQNEQDETKKKKKNDLSLEYLLFGKKNESLTDYLKSKSNTKAQKKKYKERENKRGESLEKLLGLGQRESLEDILRRKKPLENKKNKTRKDKDDRKPLLEELLYGKGDSDIKSPDSKSINNKKKEKKATNNIDSELSRLLPGFSDSRKGKLNLQYKDYHKLNESIKNSIAENIYKLRSNSYLDELKKMINKTLINEIANSLKNNSSSLNNISNSLKNNSYGKYSNSNGEETSTSSPLSKIKHLNAEDLFGKLDTESNNRLKNLNWTTTSKNPLSADDLSQSEAEKIKAEFENSKKSVSPNCLDILINDDSENVIDFSKMKNFGNCTDSHVITKTNGPKYNSKDLTSEDLIKFNKIILYKNKERVKKLNKKNEFDNINLKNNKINKLGSEKLSDKQNKKFSQNQNNERKIKNNNANKKNHINDNEKGLSKLGEQRKKKFYQNRKINQKEEKLEFNKNNLSKVDNKLKNNNNYEQGSSQLSEQGEKKFYKNRGINQNDEHNGTEFNKNNLSKVHNKPNKNYNYEQGSSQLSEQEKKKFYKNKEINQNGEQRGKEFSQNYLNEVLNKQNKYNENKSNKNNLAANYNKIIDELYKPELNEECKDKIITDRKNTKKNSFILIYNIRGDKLYLDIRANKVIYKPHKGTTREFNPKKHLNQTKNIQKNQQLYKILNNLNSTMIKDKIKSFIINSNFSSVFEGKSKSEYEKTIKKFLKNNKNFRDKLLNSFGNQTCLFSCDQNLNKSFKKTNNNNEILKKTSNNKITNETNIKDNQISNTNNLNSSQKKFEKKFFDNSDILFSKIKNMNDTGKENTIELHKNCNFSELINSLEDPNNGPEHNSLDYINTDSNSTSLKKCDSDIKINSKISNIFNSKKCKDKIIHYKTSIFLLNNNTTRKYLNKTLNRIKKIKFQDLTFDNITNLMKLFKKEKKEKLNFLSKIDRLIQIKNLLEESCDPKAFEITNIFYKGIIYKLKYLKLNKIRLRDFTMVLYDFKDMQKNLESQVCSNNNGFNKLIRLEIQKNLDIIHKLIMESPYECLNSLDFRETNLQDFNEKCQKLLKAKSLFNKLILNRTRFSILIKIISKLKNLRVKLLSNINKLYKSKESSNTTKALDIYNPKIEVAKNLNKTILRNTTNYTKINRKIFKKLPLKLKINNEIKNLLKILKKKEGEDYHFSFNNLKNHNKIKIQNSMRNLTELRNHKSIRQSNSIQYKDKNMRNPINKIHKKDSDKSDKQIKRFLIEDKCDDFIISARLKKFCFDHKGNLKYNHKNKNICRKLQKFLFNFNIKKLSTSELKMINLPTDKEIFRALRLKKSCGKRSLLKLNSKITDLKERCLGIKNSLLDRKHFNSQINTKEVSICLATLEKLNRTLKSKITKCKKYKQIIKKLSNGFQNDTVIQNNIGKYNESNITQIINMHYKIPNTNCTIEKEIKPISGPSYDWEDYLTNEILGSKPKNIKNGLQKIIPQCRDKIQKLKKATQIKKTKIHPISKTSRKRSIDKFSNEKKNCSDVQFSDNELRISGPEYFHKDIIMSKSLIKKIKKYEDECKNKENLERLKNLTFEQNQNIINTKKKNSPVINGPKETTQDVIIDSVSKNERMITKVKKAKKCYKLKEILEDEILKRKNFRFFPYKCKDKINKKKSQIKSIFANSDVNNNTNKSISLIKLNKENEMEQIFKEEGLRKRNFGSLKKLKAVKELQNFNKKDSNFNLRDLNSDCKKLRHQFTLKFKKTNEKSSRIISGPNFSAEDIILDKATISLAKDCLKNGILTNQFITKILN